MQSNQDAALLLHHELAKLLGCGEVGVGDQVDGRHGSLGLADGGQIVVGLKGLADIGSGDPECSQAVWLEPDPHGHDACSEHIGTLDAVDGGELRLNDPYQKVGDLVRLHPLIGKAQVHCRSEFVGILELDDGGF